jgi:zinc transport system substrate-binding protein
MKYLRSIILFCLLISCWSGHENPVEPVITVSILPQQFFIERIAGDLAEVNVMIPSGANPATYEPTVSQLSKLSRSEVYMRIGYVEFELAWMDKLKSANPEMRIVDLSQSIEPISEPHEEVAESLGHLHQGVDPHIWMSLVNGKIIARNVYDALAFQFPDKKELFSRNLEKLLSEIDSLHFRVTEMLFPYRSRGFIIYHPALTYFARDYHLIQLPLEIGGKIPSPAHMRQMADLGQENQISAIIIQRQFDTRNAEVLAGEIGAEIIQIDPLDPNWLSQIGTIAEQLKSSFE